MAEFMQPFVDRLYRQQQLGLYRSRNPIIERLGAKWKCKNDWFLSFMNNDYLGLATHPEVIRSFQQSAEIHGVGSSAAQLLGGYFAIHQELEEELAEFIGLERALVFSTGFMANFAVLTTLLNDKDCIFGDRLNHASVIDGSRYSKAQFKRYRRNDISALEKNIMRINAQNKWIVSEGVFSMDGEIAPLPQLFNLVKKYQCKLIIDDAHGLGVLGEGGRGSIKYYQLPVKNVSILIGTFGKSFGTMGAFVAGNGLLIETLIQFARGYIYTTALPPAIASATYTSLRLIQEENWRREHLRLLIKGFHQGSQDLNLPISPSITPIQTIIVGDTKKTLEVAQWLKQKGILVGCIRPPTVPHNTARLRINLTVHHTKHDVDFLLETLSKIWNEIH